MIFMAKIVVGTIPTRSCVDHRLFNSGSYESLNAHPDCPVAYIVQQEVQYKQTAC